jgi:hypothetical protein
LQRARVRSVARSEGPWTVELEEGAPALADAVVLAMGGLLGGGLDYTPSAALLAGPLPPSPRPTFALSIEAPTRVGAHGRPLGMPGTLFGAAPESLAWPFTDDPLLERAGVLADGEGRALGAPGGLFVCGDLAADRARTWLGALASGALAGRGAAA